ncbi:uncharacterized protein LOC123673209 isoform X4 [Harmonia axyridis]|uniref:uncharacterized protein LOC123673209 isoform X4 n=1 Tax=Harmonia axyridis TaxID=115357 RepID=UPI001E275A57|nr:uncharacterized protein LOC123673209 isoform X4 [Harmonia axyridis]
MENQREDKLYCQTCKKYFTSSGTRNRHIRTMHPEIDFENKRKKHIICPLCKNKPFSFHDHLVKHLIYHHKVKIEVLNLKFANFEEFIAWKTLENRDEYVCGRTGPQIFIYHCNRSDTRGFVSTCTKRKKKTGGSIKMIGVCPSRIIARVLENGEVMVQFLKTHIGHEDELEKLSVDFYQNRNNMDAHKKAKIMEGVVKIVDDGNCQIKSTSEKDKDYTITISLNEICDGGSRTGGVFEEDDNNSIISVSEDDNNSVISEPLASRVQYKNDVQHVVQETSTTSIQDPNTSSNLNRREIILAELNHYVELLDIKQLEHLKSIAESLASSKD